MKDSTKIVYLLAIVICATLLLTTYLPGASATQVDRDIQWCINQGILKGDGTGNYFLDRQITEEEACAFLVRLYNDKSAEPQKFVAVDDLDRNLTKVVKMSPATAAKLILSFENIIPYDYRMYKLDYKGVTVLKGNCTLRSTIWQSHKFDYDRNAEYLCRLWNIELPKDEIITRGDFIKLMYTIYNKIDKQIPVPEVLKGFRIHVDKHVNAINLLSFYDAFYFMPEQARTKIKSFDIYYTANMGNGVVSVSRRVGNTIQPVFINLATADGATWYDREIIKINTTTTNIYFVLMHEVGHVVTKPYVGRFTEAYKDEADIFDEKILNSSNHSSEAEMLADAYALLTVINDDKEMMDRLAELCPQTHYFMITNFKF